MKVKVAFRPYTIADKETCLGLFDANCPEFFASNERAGYLRFLEGSPANYDVCFIEGEVGGAFGLMGSGASRQVLVWIMLNPQFQGLGVGRSMMERVAALAASQGIQVVDIAASHKSAPFFARFGAVSITVIRDGWGPGMHRVDMELPLRPNSSLEQSRDR